MSLHSQRPSNTALYCLQVAGIKSDQAGVLKMAANRLTRTGYRTNGDEWLVSPGVDEEGCKDCGRQTCSGLYLEEWNDSRGLCSAGRPPPCNRRREAAASQRCHFPQEPRLLTARQPPAVYTFKVRHTAPQVLYQTAGLSQVEGTDHWK